MRKKFSVMLLVMLTLFLMAVCARTNVQNTGELNVYAFEQPQTNSTREPPDEEYPSADSPWHIETVVSEGDVGAYSSIALDSNYNPHITYYDNTTTGGLKYAWHDTEWHVITIEAGSGVGKYNSLALDSNDDPHISYYDEELGVLMYAYSDESGWHIDCVAGPDVGMYTSIALDSNDDPHISYYDATHGDLEYAYYHDGTWDLETVCSSGDVGLFTSIALDSNGYPHISHYNNGNWDVLYTYYDGTDWDTLTVYGSTDNYAHTDTSIAIDSDNKCYICYRLIPLIPVRMDLICAHYNGVSWGRYELDGRILIGDWNSIVMDNWDNPHIGYTAWDTLHGYYDLSYVYHYGVGSWNTETVDSGLLEYVSIALGRSDHYDMRHPHISYYDEVDGDLKYAFRNNLPSAADLSVSPTRPTNSDDLTGSYTYDDADMDPETDSEIEWYKDDVWQPVFDGLLTVPAINTSNGEKWYFSVKPRDTYHFGDTVFSPTVWINRLPVASDLSITPRYAYTTDDLVAGYTYYDADGDPEGSSEIRWYKDGQLQSAYDDQLTVPSSATSRGEQWNFTVRLYDGYEWGETYTSPAAAIVNSPPTASNVYISPSNPQTSDTLSGHYTYTDPDGDPEWWADIDWYKNGEFYENYNELTIAPGATSKGESWNFTVTPYDGYEGGETQASPAVTIINSPPTASNPYISPSNPRTSDDLVAHYTYTDPDYDPEGPSQIRWYKDGYLQSTYNDQMTVPHGATSKGEEWNFTVRPNDGYEWGETQASPAVTITNSPPKVGCVYISPSKPETSDDLVAHYTYTDPDYDPEGSSQIRWYKDGYLQPYIDQLIIPNSATSDGESWNFTVTPYDGYEWGETGTSATVYVSSRSVGGIWVPVDKLALLAPYIGLTSTLIVATAATAIYVRRVKHREKKQ